MTKKEIKIYKQKFAKEMDAITVAAKLIEIGKKQPNPHWVTVNEIFRQQKYIHQCGEMLEKIAKEVNSAIAKDYPIETKEGEKLA